MKEDLDLFFLEEYIQGEIHRLGKVVATEKRLHDMALANLAVAQEFNVPKQEQENIQKLSEHKLKLGIIEPKLEMLTKQLAIIRNI